MAACTRTLGEHRLVAGRLDVHVPSVRSIDGHRGVGGRRGVVMVAEHVDPVGG